MTKMLTAHQVADLMGLNVQTVWRWARDHSDQTPSPIPFVRMGRAIRFSRVAVEAIVNHEAA